VQHCIRTKCAPPVGEKNTQAILQPVQRNYVRGFGDIHWIYESQSRSTSCFGTRHVRWQTFFRGAGIKLRANSPLKAASHDHHEEVSRRYRSVRHSRARPPATRQMKLKSFTELESDLLASEAIYLDLIKETLAAARCSSLESPWILKLQLLDDRRLAALRETNRLLFELNEAQMTQVVLTCVKCGNPKAWETARKHTRSKVPKLRRINGYETVSWQYEDHLNPKHTGDHHGRSQPHRTFGTDPLLRA
jgi:hypothetical protein